MLRARLFLNLVPFLVILLATGVYATVLFSRLTSSVDTTITRHHENLITLQKMGDALSRMDKQMLLVLARKTNNAVQVLAAQGATFSENLKQNLHNPAVPHSTVLGQRLEADYETFQVAAWTILQEEKLPAQFEEYEHKLLPARAAIETTLAQFRRLHYGDRPRRSGNRTVDDFLDDRRLVRCSRDRQLCLLSTRTIHS